MKITVYSGPGCYKCTATKKALTKKGLTFSEVDIAENPAEADRLRAAGLAVLPVVEVQHSDGTTEVWNDLRPSLIEQLADQVAA